MSNILTIETNTACKFYAHIARVLTNTISNLPAALGLTSFVMKEAVERFNKSPKKGIAYLISEKILEDSPEYIANFLKTEKDLSLVQIGEYISDAQHTQILREYMNHFDFSHQEVDVALRQFTSFFRLPGEGKILPAYWTPLSPHPNNFLESSLLETSLTLIFQNLFRVYKLHAFVIPQSPSAILTIY